jgi:hypothetical protein
MFARNDSKSYEARGSETVLMWTIEHFEVGRDHTKKREVFLALFQQ